MGCLPPGSYGLNRPVLLGGRIGPHVRTRVGWFVSLWLPVVICLLLIGRESTDSFAAEYTSGPLRRAFESVFGTVTQEHWKIIHRVLRKTSHFMGYGVTGLLWSRAWLLTWLAPLNGKAVWLWRRTALIMGLLCTMLTASIDELHQTYLPNRTGLITDAWLDTAGATAMVLVLVLLWRLTAQPHDSLAQEERK